MEDWTPTHYGHPSIPPEWLSWQHVELILPSSLWSGCTLKTKAFWNVNAETQVIEGKIRTSILPTIWLDAMDGTETYSCQSSPISTNTPRFYHKPVQTQTQASLNSTTIKKYTITFFPPLSFHTSEVTTFILFSLCSWTIQALEVNDPCIACPFL